MEQENIVVVDITNIRNRIQNTIVQVDKEKERMELAISNKRKWTSAALYIAIQVIKSSFLNVCDITEIQVVREDMPIEDSFNIKPPYIHVVFGKRYFPFYLETVYTSEVYHKIISGDIESILVRQGCSCSKHPLSSEIVSCIQNLRGKGII